MEGTFIRDVAGINGYSPYVADKLISGRGSGGVSHGIFDLSKGAKVRIG